MTQYLLFEKSEEGLRHISFFLLFYHFIDEPLPADLFEVIAGENIVPPLNGLLDVILVECLLDLSDRFLPSTIYFQLIQKIDYNASRLGTCQLPVLFQ